LRIEDKQQMMLEWNFENQDLRKKRKWN